MPSQRLSIFRSLLLALLVYAPYGADATPQKSKKTLLTIDEAVARALDNSPLVREIEASFAARSAEAFDAKTLPNPQFDAEVGLPSSSSNEQTDSEIQLAITQPFRLTHGRRRNRLARLIERAGAWERKRAILELVTRVRLAYGRACVLSKRSTLLESLNSEARTLSQSVTAGVREGAYGPVDESLFRAEVIRIEAALKGLTAGSLAASAELARFGRFTLEDARVECPSLPSPPNPAALEEHLNNSQTAAQERAKLLLDLARADDEVARADAFPELRPRLGYAHTSEGIDLIGIGVSFDLPFASRNTAERIKKQGALRAADAAWMATNDESFKQSILTAVRAQSLRHEELDLYEKKLLPALKEALAASQKQLRSAEASIAQVWQTLREYGESHERYLELWTRAFADRLELSLILEEDL